MNHPTGPHGQDDAHSAPGQSLASRRAFQPMGMDGGGGLAPTSIHIEALCSSLLVCSPWDPSGTRCSLVVPKLLGAHGPRFGNLSPRVSSSYLHVLLCNE